MPEVTEEPLQTVKIITNDTLIFDLNVKVQNNQVTFVLTLSASVSK